ncbi:sigma-70 family RNA polymerase sigma factor [Microbacterium sp. M28]|uniref:RNA polymerase sigma factor n=1 Tax=Microbacterium sp. M28 TaxID=2962064 RepID=UPI0021F3EA31|nr:sigma-70 family RNA polymerase sigma factor [Microbacterium sp. M28]UYO96180.1 sigma-70 family RNA polymerase sigma factor [Microbacterium sp. M28]
MTDRSGAIDVDAELARTHREEWTRIVAGLVRRYADLDIAEETAAEAFATAVERWPIDGVPPSPGAWITTTAHRKAIDRLRREARRDDKQREAFMLQDDSPAEPTGYIEDDRLRLIFTCCHPVLSIQDRIALTLRMVGGLTVAEIARAFLVPQTTMGQRISRAKARIKAARVPYVVPRREDIAPRVSDVLAVLYLIFNEGYFASGENVDPIRRDLAEEAIRLARLVRELLPSGSDEDAEATGLLALMLLTQARADARLSAGGELVRLDEQERNAWDRTLIREGIALVDERLEAGGHDVGALGRYQLLAAINAVHVSAPRAQDTDWSRIVALYDALERIDPSPIVRLNRAIAISEYDSPDVALALVDELGDDLAEHHAFHTTRAELLRLTGRSDAARGAYDRAIDLAVNAAEITHLTRRRDQVAAASQTDGTTDEGELS